MKKYFPHIILLMLAANCSSVLFAQEQSDLWHDKERSVHYKPAGNDFITVNGKMRFNRALYGGNTAFRAEAGDLPEFALYMPGMGGNLRFGLVTSGKSKWLIDAKNIEARYRPGSMIYAIRDSMLKTGYIIITAIALYDSEGLIVKAESHNIPADLKFFVAFGGATGQKFSRDGDIGADPESSFHLKPEYCKDNIYRLEKSTFNLHYGFKKALTDDERYEVQHLPVQKKDTSTKVPSYKTLTGVFPVSAAIKLSDASLQTTPAEFYSSAASAAPAITTEISFSANEPLFFLVKNPVVDEVIAYSSLPQIFSAAENARKQLAEQIKVNTPDPYINTIGGALSVAADAIWEAPSYMHGAVAWRMRLNGWRGPYIADVTGRHDRAEQHFSSYALSQITSPDSGPVVSDTALHLARQQEKLGTSVFSSGYISRNPGGDQRPHHYDMNLVYIDELLNHFSWTGDTTYAKKMWPVITRHLDWEKRNFDSDGDGLYDAYAAIWASDALQYSGGGVTHSSAYNYRANKTAAEIAKIIGESGTKYQQEADKIYAAVQKELWLKNDGWYAEYKDLLGNKLVHPSAGLWTIYHAIDSKLPDPFQAYQSLRYVDREIPHIPVKAKGWNEKDLYLLSTTNWQPYTWSLNNVVLAENLHMSLAYWQGNRSEEAYKLWRSSIMESMYLSASPGGFEQLSFYDAIRGELYRDFADPIGMVGRSLIEGLFGIQPDAMHDTLTIQPGFPAKWNYASLQTPDIKFDFKRTANIETFTISQSFKNLQRLKLLISATQYEIETVTVNGLKTNWKNTDASVGKPMLQIIAAPAPNYNVVIRYKGEQINNKKAEGSIAVINKKSFVFKGIKVLSFYDPLQELTKAKILNGQLFFDTKGTFKNDMIFVKVQKGSFTWWKPLDLVILWDVKFSTFGHSVDIDPVVYDKIDLSNSFNDKVTNIFKHQYLSPRPAVSTLQLPTQGIGNWCYPMTTANIDDSGLRMKAGTKAEIKTDAGVPFKISPDSNANNILFTSQWDNFPQAATVPLSGKSSRIYLLMAGTTNPMQSRITNGMVVVNYTDNSSDTLLLNNPESWVPIEQDYYKDEYAFYTTEAVLYRLYFKEGKFATGLDKYSTIKGFTNMAIDGGAGTVLKMDTDPAKTLRSLTVTAVANDVIIGLMAVTLKR